MRRSTVDSVTSVHDPNLDLHFVVPNPTPLGVGLLAGSDAPRLEAGPLLTAGLQDLLGLRAASDRSRHRQLPSLFEARDDTHHPICGGYQGNEGAFTNPLTRRSPAAERLIPLLIFSGLLSWLWPCWVSSTVPLSVPDNAFDILFAFSTPLFFIDHRFRLPLNLAKKRGHKSVRHGFGLGCPLIYLIGAFETSENFRNSIILQLRIWALFYELNLTNRTFDGGEGVNREPAGFCLPTPPPSASPPNPTTRPPLFPTPPMRWLGKGSVHGITPHCVTTQKTSWEPLISQLFPKIFQRAENTIVSY